MTLQGSKGPELLAPQSSPYPASPRPPPGTLQDSVQGDGKLRLFANRRPLPPSWMYTQGPGKKPLSAPPGANPKGTGAAVSHLFTHRAATESRPGRAFSRGLGAPHGPRPPGGRGEEGLRPPEPPGPPQAVGAWRARDRVAPHSPRLWPPSLHHGRGESSLSRKSPPQEGTGAATGAAAKPRTPEGDVVAAAAAGAAEAQCPPSRIGSLAAAATRVPGSTGEPGGGHRLQWDDRGAAGGDSPRSLQRRGRRSSRPRRWATAPPGPLVPLRRRDCGCRAGHERQGTRRSAAWGWRGPRAPCAALRPPLTTLPESRKPRFPPTPCGPHPRQTPAPFPSLQKVVLKIKPSTSQPNVSGIYKHPPLCPAPGLEFGNPAGFTSWDYSSRQTQHLCLHVVLRIEPGPQACQASALPLEPHPQPPSFIF
ncbi:uncharacterized protein LOC144368564 [Ictidomys tridecemlineatus]